jgi:hypothetical protein
VFLGRRLGLDLARIRNAAGEIDEGLVTLEPRETLLVFGRK